MAAAHYAESFNLPGRFGFGRTLALPIAARHGLGFNLPGRFGFGRTLCTAILKKVPKGFNLPGRFGFGRTLALPIAARHGLGFNLPGRFGFGRTLCTAILKKVPKGFNLPGRFGFGRTPSPWFARRQLKSCFNLPGRFGFGRTAKRSTVRASRKCFNLPGRFGFGRTNAIHQATVDLGWFQSARQIWVWPNLVRHHHCLYRQWVSICQADLGLAERHEVVASLQVAKVSICQADLGLAELINNRSLHHYVHMFQSARQIWVWPNAQRYCLPHAAQTVSICQADLGLAERKLPARGQREVVCFNLPGRFGFGRTENTDQAQLKRKKVSICQADLGLAER